MKVVAVLAQSPRVAPVPVLTLGDGTTVQPAAAEPRPEGGSRDVVPEALLADVLAAARGVAGAVVRVAVLPHATRDDMGALGVPQGQVLEQRGETPGERWRGVFSNLFRRGAKHVVLVGADARSLTPAMLEDAFAALAGHPMQVAIGPSSDGGYYLLGLSGPTAPDLFTGVRWGTRYALVDTLRRCEFEDRRVTLLPVMEVIGGAAPETSAGYCQ